MSGTFGQILHDYREFIMVGLTTALLVVLLVMYWDRVSLWALNVLYSLPLIGRVSRLSSDITKVAGDEWYKSERKLCSDYKRHVRAQDRQQFLECQMYLEKSGDAGRTPFPFGIWVLIIGLVFVEALGFSYVLAGWTVPGASENTQVQASYGIAFMLSVVLVFLTHLTGHELHRSLQIRRAQMHWSQDANSNSFTSAAFTLARTLTNPADSQAADDRQPRYAQLLARVGDDASYARTILTAVFVVAVAVFATYVRLETFELQQTEETIGAADPYYSEAPAELSAVQAAADDKARAEAGATRSSASLATFILLAVIFVFLQILGVLFGMKWGFAGKESALAYKLTGGGRFSSFDEYKSFYYDRVADAAQSKLDSLRQKMQKKGSKHGKRLELTPKSFVHFVEDERVRNVIAPSRPTTPATPSVTTAPEPPVAAPLTPPPAAQQRPLAPPPARPLAPPPAVRKYFYTDADNKPSSAPVSWRELEQLFAAATITAETYVNEEQTTLWTTFAEARAAQANPKGSG
jgi:hypothetical protein